MRSKGRRGKAFTSPSVHDGDNSNDNDDGSSSSLGLWRGSLPPPSPPNIASNAPSTNNHHNLHRSSSSGAGAAASSIQQYQQHRRPNSIPGVTSNTNNANVSPATSADPRPRHRRSSLLATVTTIVAVAPQQQQQPSRSSSPAGSVLSEVMGGTTTTATATRARAVAAAREEVERLMANQHAYSAAVVRVLDDLETQCRRDDDGNEDNEWKGEEVAGQSNTNYTSHYDNSNEGEQRHQQQQQRQVPMSALRHAEQERDTAIRLLRQFKEEATSVVRRLHAAVQQRERDNVELDDAVRSLRSENQRLNATLTGSKNGNRNDNYNGDGDHRNNDTNNDDDDDANVDDTGASVREVSLEARLRAQKLAIRELGQLLASADETMADLRRRTEQAEDQRQALLLQAATTSLDFLGFTKKKKRSGVVVNDAATGNAATNLRSSEDRAAAAAGGNGHNTNDINGNQDYHQDGDDEDEEEEEEVDPARHRPPPMQRLLLRLPADIDMLNVDDLLCAARARILSLRSSLRSEQAGRLQAEESAQRIAERTEASVQLLERRLHRAELNAASPTATETATAATPPYLSAAAATGTVTTTTLPMPSARPDRGAAENNEEDEEDEEGSGGGDGGGVSVDASAAAVGKEGNFDGLENDAGGGTSPSDASPSSDSSSITRITTSSRWSDEPAPNANDDDDRDGRQHPYQGIISSNLHQRGGRNGTDSPVVGTEEKDESATAASTHELLTANSDPRTDAVTSPTTRSGVVRNGGGQHHRDHPPLIHTGTAGREMEKEKGGVEAARPVDIDAFSGSSKKVTLGATATPPAVPVSAM